MIFAKFLSSVSDFPFLVGNPEELSFGQFRSVQSYSPLRAEPPSWSLVSFRLRFWISHSLSGTPISFPLVKQLHCRDWIFFLRMLKPWYSQFRISPSLISCPLTWLWPCMGLCLKVLLESESPSRSLLSFCLLGLCGFVFPILWHDRDHLLMSVRPEPLLSFSLLGLWCFGFTVLWFRVFWHDCDRVLFFVLKSS